MELLREISRRLREFDQRYIQEILQSERLAVVGRFARSIVHDLKNPLNIIGLSAEMTTLQKATPESRQRAATTIRDQVERISDLIGEILDFTQGSRADYVLGMADYATFARQTLEEMRAEVEPRGIRLESEVPPSVLKLSFDPKRLRRVFENLIHNAAEAVPAGGTVLVRVHVQGGDVITEIEDTGPGIAPQIAGKLFEPFATYGKVHGTGLGLSICKRIVEDHRGRIWAGNKPGGGAVFCFASVWSVRSVWSVWSVWSVETLLRERIRYWLCQELKMSRFYKNKLCTVSPGSRESKHAHTLSTLDTLHTLHTPQRPQ